MKVSKVSLRTNIVMVNILEVSLAIDKLGIAVLLLLKMFISYRNT